MQAENIGLPVFGESVGRKKLPCRLYRRALMEKEGCRSRSRLYPAILSQPSCQHGGRTILISALRPAQCPVISVWSEDQSPRLEQVQRNCGYVAKAARPPSPRQLH